MFLSADVLNVGRKSARKLGFDVAVSKIEGDDFGALFRADEVTHQDIELIVLGVKILDVFAHIGVVERLDCFWTDDEDRVCELALQDKESLWFFFVLSEIGWQAFFDITLGRKSVVFSCVERTQGGIFTSAVVVVSEEQIVRTIYSVRITPKHYAFATHAADRQTVNKVNIGT